MPAGDKARRPERERRKKKKKKSVREERQSLLDLEERGRERSAVRRIKG